MYSNRLSALLLATLLTLGGSPFGGLLAAQESQTEPAPSAEAPGDPAPPVDAEEAAPAPPAEQPQAAPQGEAPAADPPAAEETQEKPAPATPGEAQEEGKQSQESEGHGAESAEPSAKQARAAKQPTAELHRPAVAWDAEIERVTRKKSPENLEDLRLIQKQVRAVVEYARPATVGVQVAGSIGSAVIVSEDGLALTAGHVAMKPNQRVLFFFADGRRARGVTLGVNSSVDSGMMKITDKGPWPYVPMAPVGSVSPGDWVVGLGQPNGFFADRAPPVRLGRILFGDKTTLCTDVTLVGGDSGGPLFNLKGQVVGIHSRIGRRIVSNYHVPVDQFHTTWDRLAGGQMWGGGLGASEPTRHRAFLGVASNSLHGRCRLTQVYPGRPAARAGMRVGDIVTRFGDEEITTIEDFSRVLEAQKPGATVKIQVERDGKTLDLEARLTIVSVDFPGAPPVESDS